MPSPDGSAIATFYDTASYVFELSHGYHVRLTWESERRLTVGYPASADVDTALALAREAGREVAVRYVALPDSMGSLPPNVAGCVRGPALPPPPAPRLSP